MTTAIEIADLFFVYRSPLSEPASAPALDHVSFTIESGQVVALAGPVGAGKSSLCLCLNGIIPHKIGGRFGGRVTVHGLDTADHSVERIAQHVGIVFEDAEVQLFNASVEDEIAFGLEEMGWQADAIEERIEWALEAVGLMGFRHRSPQTLSGGEQKRLAIATVLAAAPSIVVLDEPTAGLDSRGKQEVMQVIEQLVVERHSTVIMASQDPDIIARYADRIILLNDGKVVLDDTVTSAYMRLAGDPTSCIGIPQMATVAHQLTSRMRRSFAFVTPEEGYRSLRGLLRSGHDINALETP